jgi:hypothetical protein
VSNSGQEWPISLSTINLSPATLPKAGSHYDLSKVHADGLRAALDPYMRAGRKTGGRRRSHAAATDGDQIKDIRDWAKKQGLKVSDRGRVSADVREAYTKAH